MCPEQGTGEGEGRAGRLQASDASRLGTQRGGSGGRGRGGRGGLGGLGVYRHLTQGKLSTQGLRSVASRVQGSGSGLGSKLQGLGFLCRGLVHEEPRSQQLGRSTPHRRDYPSIGCLQCITTTSTGIGWTGGKGREAARCGRDTTFETTNTSSAGPATH